MIRNVLKPDGTVHIEQQVANMRYDLTTGQVETVVPGAGATNLVFGADGRRLRPRRSGRTWTTSLLELAYTAALIPAPAALYTPLPKLDG